MDKQELIAGEHEIIMTNTQLRTWLAEDFKSGLILGTAGGAIVALIAVGVLKTAGLA